MMTTKKTLLFTATNDKGQSFEIRNGGNGVGFYLFVYENGKCIWDDLQDTVEWVQTIAYEKYAVSKSAWKNAQST